MRILFCNIAYMKYYKGTCDQDKAYGGGSFVDANGYGHEEYNFKPEYIEFKDTGMEPGDYCLGFFETKMSKGNKLNELHIERIEGCIEPATEVDGVLTVFCAPRQFQNYTTVVGWYKESTVYRNYQQCFFAGENGGEDYVQYYNILAKADDCVLLPAKARTRDLWNVPRRAAGASFGLGRANVWFAEGREKNKLLDEYLKRIVDQIENYRGENWLDKYPDI
ncbi:hypothetical protein SAMN02910292_02694 [Lachnospiraceae bacterium XBB2008]|nr:hypothetical protein SAMN02910292_02694 [Lachnospiraceae bacterium XBB2008]